jgi:hypothetical protein
MKDLNRMKTRNTKYTGLLTWINTTIEEFTVRKAKTENCMARSSCENILFLLHKVGLLQRKICDNRFGTRLYYKTLDWNLDKALEANSNRLKAKWQRQKSRK